MADLSSPNPTPDLPASQPGRPPVAPSSPPAARRKGVSFSIGNRLSGDATEGGYRRVNPFPITQPHTPALPRPKRPSFSRHRHDANPALAIKVLQDIQRAVESWHQDLRQVVVDIQALYLEGPIVDGWLEAVEPASPIASALDTAILRHADPADLSGYIDQICQASDAASGQGASPSGDGPPIQYRLCTLDADGRRQCLPCPPQQLSTISLAVARNQKLRQLLNHKNYLEARLKRAVEALSLVRDDLGIAASPSTTVDEALQLPPDGAEGDLGPEPNYPNA